PGLQRSLERGSRGRPGADGADRGGDRRRHAEDADHLVGDRHGAGHFAGGAAGAAFDRVLAAAAAPAHRTGAVVARLAAAIAETALRLLAGGADPDHGFADHHLLGAGQVDPGLQAQRPAVGYLGPADVGAERGEPGCAFRIDDARATLAVALAVVLFATRRHPGPPRIDGHVGVVADLPGISGAASVLGRATEQAVVAHALGAAGMAVEAEAFHAGGALLVAQQADVYLPRRAALRDGAGPAAIAGLPADVRVLAARHVVARAGGGLADIDHRQGLVGDLEDAVELARPCVSGQGEDQQAGEGPGEQAGKFHVGSSVARECLMRTACTSAARASASIALGTSWSPTMKAGVPWMPSAAATAALPSSSASMAGSSRSAWNRAMSRCIAAAMASMAAAS